MPELPEVEIVRQSLDKKIRGQIIKKVIIKNRNLRFKVPRNFEGNFKNYKIVRVDTKLQDNIPLFYEVFVRG